MNYGAGTNREAGTKATNREVRARAMMNGFSYSFHSYYKN